MTINKMVSARDTLIRLHTPVPFTPVLQEKFQFFLGGGGILGKLGTKVPKSSRRGSNYGWGDSW